MGWMLWQKPTAQVLSDQLKQHLIAEFSVDPIILNKMRFSGKKGTYSSRPVKYIRIYDPELVTSNGPAPLGYDTLAQKSVNGAALLFDGRIEANKQVYLTDHRKPADLPYPS